MNILFFRKFYKDEVIKNGKLKTQIYISDIIGCDVIENKIASIPHEAILFHTSAD